MVIKDKSNIVMPIPLRGPAALTLVVAVLVGPHVQQLQLETVIKLLLVLLAVRLTFMDFKNWAITSSRHHIKRSLQKVVLDDLLSSVFHPETGLIATCVTASLGNCAMYALPTTAQQRAQIMQYAFNDDSAEKILQVPGGITELLPQSVQAWLQADDDVGNSRNHRQAVESLSPVLSSQAEPRDVHNLTLLSDFNSEDDDDSSSVMSSEECASPTHQPKQPSVTTAKKQQSHDPLTPMEILGSVLGDVTSRQIKHMLDGLPPRRLQITSVAAAALLWAQFRSSKRARDIVWTILHASVSLTGSAVLTGSLLALWARHQLSPVDSYRSTDFHSFFFVLPKLQTAGHALKNVMKSAVQSERARKVQGMLAVLVLAYFGRRRMMIRR